MRIVLTGSQRKDRVRKTYRFRPELVDQIDKVLADAAAKGLKGISEQKLVESILEQALSDSTFVLKIRK